MKTQRVFYGLMVVGSLLFSGCNNDVDLGNIDTRAELEMGLAMPIGWLSATVGDFLGNGQVEGIYVGDNDVLYYRDTFDVSRKYHDVKMWEKVSKVTKSFNVYKELDRQGILDANGTVKKTGKQIKLEFPFAMKLNKVNNALADERIDSVMITDATFSSYIGSQNLPLQTKWVDKVEIVLGDEFHRKNKSIIVCNKGEFAYSTNIPITVDEFVLDLMKKHNPSHWSEFKTNVKDSCHLQINFYITIPSGTTIKIPETASYSYQLQLKFMDFLAVWGFFKPSADMRDADTIDLAEEWESWKLFQKAKLPFYDPRVTLHITSKIAGAMCLHGEYAYVTALPKNETKFATFNEAGTQIFRNESFNTKGQYLELSSKIGDSIVTPVLFDKDPLRGHIDRLFELRPDLLGYKFYLDYDSIVTPQIRLLKSTKMKMEADVYSQLRFNKGVEVSYTDTLKDIDLSTISLDSLANSTSMVDTFKTADLKLVLICKNKLPFRVRAVPRFLDENGNEVKDPSDPKQPLRISAPSDTLLLNAPEVVFEQGRSYIGEAATDTFTIAMDRAHYETFAQIKMMQFYAELDAEQMNPAYDRDPEYKVQVTKEDMLKVHLGISAHADAILNFGNNENK